MPASRSSGRRCRTGRRHDRRHRRCGRDGTVDRRSAHCSRTVRRRVSIRPRGRRAHRFGGRWDRRRVVHAPRAPRRHRPTHRHDRAAVHRRDRHRRIRHRGCAAPGPGRHRIGSRDGGDQLLRDQPEHPERRCLRHPRRGACEGGVRDADGLLRPAGLLRRPGHPVPPSVRRRRGRPGRGGGLGATSCAADPQRPPADPAHHGGLPQERLHLRASAETRLLPRERLRRRIRDDQRRTGAGSAPVRPCSSPGSDSPPNR
jgi:hypothetical protein